MTDIVKIKKWIDEADAIIIGAGAGLSDAAGIHLLTINVSRTTIFKLLSASNST